MLGLTHFHPQSTKHFGKLTNSTAGLDRLYLILCLYIFIRVKVYQKHQLFQIELFKLETGHRLSGPAGAMLYIA